MLFKKHFVKKLFLHMWLFSNVNWSLKLQEIKCDCTSLPFSSKCVEEVGGGWWSEYFQVNFINFSSRLDIEVHFNDPDLQLRRRNKGKVVNSGSRILLERRRDKNISGITKTYFLQPKQETFPESHWSSTSCWSYGCSCEFLFTFLSPPPLSLFKTFIFHTNEICNLELCN